MKRAAVSAGIMTCSAALVWGAGVIITGDPILNAPTKGGETEIAFVGLELIPQSSTCIHDDRHFVDFEPVFTPAMGGLAVTQSMLDGFTLNSNGTLRLSLDGWYDWASGSVSVGIPPLAWGEIHAVESIHLCQGGAQEMCHACGRMHARDEDADCSHDASCEARYDAGSDCTCAPTFLRVNWHGDDKVFYRALGVTRSCWCHTTEMEDSHISGLSSTEELKLWNGSEEATSGSSEFTIEAVKATAGIGTGSFQYEVHDATNGILRAFVRHVTAANLELRPDWDDSGAVDASDCGLLFSEYRPERWQLRVRETPYLLELTNAAPSGVTMTVGLADVSGAEPLLSDDATGGPVTPQRNLRQGILIDTSAGPGDASILGTLGVSAAETNIVDVIAVHVVDTEVGERWIPAGPSSSVAYDFSDVDGDVYWEVWRETEHGDEYVDWGTGAAFTLQGLEAGDYRVGVYFADICEDGYRGFFSVGDLHVVGVRLARLYETANPANFIFNPTRKDDTSGNFAGDVVHAGTTNEERYACHRNYLYVVGDPTTGSFNVTAEFAATGAQSCTNFHCAFYEDNVKVPNSETNVDLSAGTVSFSVPATTSEATNVVYELRGGLDSNGNGLLDDAEASPFVAYTNTQNEVKYACVKGITKEKYAVDRIGRHNEAFWMNDTPASIILPHARTMLMLFYENGSLANINPNLRPSSQLSGQLAFNAFSTDSSCFAEWLTHNSGYDSSTNETGMITKYVWPTDSPMSTFFAKRYPLALITAPSTQNIIVDDSSPTPTGEKMKAFYDEHVKSIAEGLLSSAEDGTEITLPSATSWYDCSCLFESASSNWVSGITLTIGEDPGYGGGYVTPITDAIGNINKWDEFDAFGAIGRGRILNPRCRFKIRKNINLLGLLTSYDVTSLDLACTLTDLYDFNNEDGGRASGAASLQIGHGNGAISGYSGHGKIFIHEILIEKSYDDPFRYYRRTL